ncbi:hypothetical protein EVAR_97255_1 [Eumeta japonica]|uniref:Uncharacterized protein n=1 Tax=Eumeta variegata TaxID=151549 RepID=A0A4C1ZFS1_EUMVA|nr:hypothetical protein EVAR_97255_1 [Eumeta japonica]
MAASLRHIQIVRFISRGHAPCCAFVDLKPLIRAVVSGRRGVANRPNKTMHVLLARFDTPRSGRMRYPLIAVDRIEEKIRKRTDALSLAGVTAHLRVRSGTCGPRAFQLKPSSVIDFNSELS